MNKYEGKNCFEIHENDHFAARISDSEMDAIRQIEAAIAKAEGADHE